MRVLIDTCVVVDVLQSREPFVADSQKIFILAANQQFIGCITAKSVTDIYYLTSTQQEVSLLYRRRDEL